MSKYSHIEDAWVREALSAYTVREKRGDFKIMGKEAVNE